jgi:hypothetical protein
METDFWNMADQNPWATTTTSNTTPYFAQQPIKGL